MPNLSKISHGDEILSQKGVPLTVSPHPPPPPPLLKPPLNPSLESLLAMYVTSDIFLMLPLIYLYVSCVYRIQSNYRIYPYKRTVKQFCSLQITASVLFIYFFIQAYVMGTHLNCINLLMQFK